VTKVFDGHVPDEVYEHARQYFAEKELVDLTLAVITINGWNRLPLAAEPCRTYQPAGPRKERNDGHTGLV